MFQLSDSGRQLVHDLAQQHGVSTDGVTHMLVAVHNGNGSMAQFNHPDFGGAGQWMRGGMTMVSDLFNQQLKWRVSSLCEDIACQLANHQFAPFSGSFQSQSQNGTSSQSQASGQMGSNNSLFVPDPEANWWPQELGSPNAVGSQNSVKYAYFADIHRLAVTTGGEPWVYDTLDHQIGGFGQQQGGGASITFTSQYGTVDLSTLPVVSRAGVTQPPVTQPFSESVESVTPNPTMDNCQTHGSGDVARTEHANSEPVANEDVLQTLERLGGLMEKGYLSKEEFGSKKSELLKRL